MSVEICAVGGYGEVGRNMTAVKVDDKVIIFDMGLHLPNYIKATDEEHDSFVRINEQVLKKAEAIPQDKLIKDWRSCFPPGSPSSGGRRTTSSGRSSPTTHWRCYGHACGWRTSGRSRSSALPLRCRPCMVLRQSYRVCPC